VFLQTRKQTLVKNTQLAQKKMATARLSRAALVSELAHRTAGIDRLLPRILVRR
jgi:hypothetical protein